MSTTPTPKTPPIAIPMIPSSICTKSPNYPSPNSHPLSSSDYYNNNNATHLPSYSRPYSNVFSQDHFLLDSSPYRFLCTLIIAYTLLDHLALKIDRNDEPQKIMHHFFDEWPPNDDNNKDSSTPQLSISIPSPVQGFRRSWMSSSMLLYHTCT
ncbi:hypothetical protein HanXRQr2_Chr08g0336551 [Helianthus annuus]|uniref:Uncharacterized protein n=1 Tax=Helianthus annuus TaxID=4232 RepID=A0A9K3NCH4_HELAN|nr:hypothetical protein HanXRQr2_Chr08g0336551 [Helianthus annuus]KAJ0553342.1 putative growth-regulating factor [Helianthus annuus]KAJ0722251.1 putative growth-regulating factor [Helianthus annuus]KAJ0901424.1 hypothetical protein HanPSC8_Chr08g0325161 [Helianthus annuus]